jgi:hypothetical protein
MRGSAMTAIDFGIAREIAEIVAGIEVRSRY